MLSLIHFKYKDTNRLKIKGYRKICHTNQEKDYDKRQKAIL